MLIGCLRSREEGRALTAWLVLKSVGLRKSKSRTFSQILLDGVKSVLETLGVTD